MTDTPRTPEGEGPQAPPPGDAPGSAHSFGDAAGEMANETEIESGRSGDVSEADIAGEADVAGEVDELSAAKAALADRTLDLQRLQAEYVNYKRRVDRDRELVRENATYAALAPIIEVLDTIDRAREHGELDGGFKAVGEQLERIVSNQGLKRFGAPGDAFDPNVHEALSHIGTDPEVAVTTCQHVAKVGYKIGDRVVRAAQVLVVDPVEQDAPES